MSLIFVTFLFLNNSLALKKITKKSGFKNKEQNTKAQNKVYIKKKICWWWFLGRQCEATGEWIYIEADERAAAFPSDV